MKSSRKSRICSKLRRNILNLSYKEGSVKISFMIGNDWQHVYLKFQPQYYVKSPQSGGSLVSPVWCHFGHASKVRYVGCSNNCMTRGGCTTILTSLWQVSVDHTMMQGQIEQNTLLLQHDIDEFNIESTNMVQHFK